MAAMHHGATAAAFRRRRLTNDNISLLRPPSFISCSHASFPAKPTRRRNQLRQKILKTLKTPITPKLPPPNPIVPVESPPQELEEIDINKEIQEFEKSESSAVAEKGETQELQEVGVSAPAGVGIDGGIGVAGKDSILKYGFWFLGAFVFQTVCAVMFFGLDDVDNKRKIVNGSSELREKGAVLGRDAGMGLGNSVIGTGNVIVEPLEMERKIEEIRVMAREVREKERLQSKRNGSGGDGDDESEDDEGTNEDKNLKSEIEEEVDGAMDKLKKKLGKKRFKTPLVGQSSGETKGGDEDVKGDLFYRKKYKFRDFSGDTVEKPKGFVGSDDSRVNADIEEGNELFRVDNGDANAANLGDGKRQNELSDDDPKGTDVDGKRQNELSDDDPKGTGAVQVVEDDSKKGMSEKAESSRNTRSRVTNEMGTSKQGKRKGVAKPKVINGKASVETMKSRKASNLDTAVVSDKLSIGNGSVRGKGFGNTKSMSKSKSETGLWWKNLPYVLVIFMQRGTGGEGLYTLKSNSNSDEQISYTVAFEDRKDATNFCYLLESFFEDLGDFKADVAPLTVKELKEAVRSYSLRPLVVKRGQLQLYAGQPLAEAEMALRAMIE